MGHSKTRVTKSRSGTASAVSAKSVRGSRDWSSSSRNASACHRYVRLNDNEPYALIKHKFYHKRNVILANILCLFLSYLFFFKTIDGQNKLLAIIGESLDETSEVTEMKFYTKRFTKHKIPWQYETKAPRNILAKHFWNSSVRRKHDKTAKYYIQFNPNTKHSLLQLKQQNWHIPYENEGFKVFLINLFQDGKGKFQGTDMNDSDLAKDTVGLAQEILDQIFSYLGLTNSEVLERTTIFAPQRLSCSFIEFAQSHKFGNLLISNSDCTNANTLETLQFANEPGCYWISPGMDPQETTIDTDLEQFNFVNITTLIKKYGEEPTLLKNWQYQYPEEFKLILEDTAKLKKEVTMGMDFEKMEQEEKERAEAFEKEAAQNAATTKTPTEGTMPELHEAAIDFAKTAEPKSSINPQSPAAVGPMTASNMLQPENILNLLQTAQNQNVQSPVPANPLVTLSPVVIDPLANRNIAW